MTPSDLKIRFDELCAGRALGEALDQHATAGRVSLKFQ
jgi:hypothetical protein